MTFWQEWAPTEVANTGWDRFFDKESLTLLRQDEVAEVMSAEAYLSWDDLVGQR